MKVLLLCLALGAVASRSALAAPTSAVIENTGSTNSGGYRITVSADGTATWLATIHGMDESKATVHTDRIPAALTSRFFTDLKAASPLSGHRSIPCMKSASFGTAEFIECGTDKSPDLSCPEIDPGLHALLQDAKAITKQLNLRF